MNHTPVQGTAVPQWDWVADYAPGTFHLTAASSRIIYMCPCGCGQARELRLIRSDADGSGWRWDGNREQPTLTPSIRHLDRCKWHGFLRAGVWEPCGDSGQ